MVAPVGLATDAAGGEETKVRKGKEAKAVVWGAPSLQVSCISEGLSTTSLTGTQPRRSLTEPGLWSR